MILTNIFSYSCQAHDRAHRIGQKKPVTIYQLVTRGAVEERVFHRAQQKLALNELVLRDDGQLLSSLTSPIRPPRTNHVALPREGLDTEGSMKGRVIVKDFSDINRASLAGS